MTQEVEVGVKVVGEGLQEGQKGAEKLADNLKKSEKASDGLEASLKKQEARIKLIDGAINVLGGSVELAVGSISALGLVSEEQAEEFQSAALGAIAFADGAKRTFDGVKSLTEGIQLYGGVQKVATGLTTAFGVALKVAMGPVGIAIAAIGAITAAIVLLKDKFEVVNKVAEFFGNAFNKVAEAVGLAATAEEKFAKSQGEAAKESEFQLKLLKAQGASFEELAKAERKLLTERVNSFKKGTEDRKKAEEELKVFEAQVITDRAAAQKAANEKRKADEEKAAQDRFNILNKELQDREARLKEYEDARIAKEAADRAKRISDAQFLAEYEADLDREAFEEVLVNLEKQKAAGQKATDTAIQQAQALSDARNALLGNTAAAIGALGNLFEEGTAAAKTAALAELAITTATGFINALDIAQKSAKATGPAAAFAFPIFYASQIAAVLGAVASAKQILSTTPGGAGGGSTPNPSATGGGGGTPSFPSLGGGVTGLPAGTAPVGPAAGAEPVRAYVVSSDVTNGVQAQGQIRRRRRLGPG